MSEINPFVSFDQPTKYTKSLNFETNKKKTEKMSKERKET